MSINIMPLEMALAYIQERGGFLHFDDERGVDLFSPQVHQPLSLRRAIFKYRDDIITMMKQADVRTCPDRRLHSKYSRGKRVCRVCKRIKVA